MLKDIQDIFFLKIIEIIFIPGVHYPYHDINLVVSN
jgi:hypothetical protein